MHWLVVVDLVILQPCNIMSTVMHQPRGVELTTHSTNGKTTTTTMTPMSGKSDVDRYVAMRLTAEQTNSYERLVDGEPTFDVTKFRFDPAIQAQMPLLCRVAIGVLSVPASSASSERVFSTAGTVLEKRRCQLSSSSVDDLIFLHSYHHAEISVLLVNDSTSNCVVGERLNVLRAVMSVNLNIYGRMSTTPSCVYDPLFK